jgi:hypothetical protein
MKVALELWLGLVGIVVGIKLSLTKSDTRPRRKS